VLPQGLLRPTTATSAAEPVDDGADLAAAGDGEQSRGDASAEARPSRTRRKRLPVSGETKGRKLHLPDHVHDRLVLLAIKRKSTSSAVAAEILDRSLPRLKIETDE
jgi:hypothetical protein